MKIEERLLDWLRNVLSSVDMRPIEEENYAELCSWKHIAKLYYDFDLGEDTPYRNKRMQELIAPGSLSEKTVIIYDSGRKPGYLYSKPFYHKGSEYCHVYIAFNEEIDEADVDKDLCDLMIEILYIYGSRINMQVAGRGDEHGETAGFHQDAIARFPGDGLRRFCFSSVFAR